MTGTETALLMKENLSMCKIPGNPVVGKPIDQRRLRWARRAQLTELHIVLTQKIQYLHSIRMAGSRTHAQTLQQRAGIEEDLRRIERKV